MIITMAAAMLFQSATVKAVTTQAEPSLEHFTAVVEAAIKQELIDPSSAQFEWPYTFKRASNGLITCGLVNSKNRMGGYSGRAYVIVVYNEGRAPYFNIAESASRWDSVHSTCAEDVRKGLIAPRG